jgi:hypothetical protein
MILMRVAFESAMATSRRFGERNGILSPDFLLEKRGQNSSWVTPILMSKIEGRCYCASVIRGCGVKALHREQFEFAAGVNP